MPRERRLHVARHVDLRHHRDVVAPRQLDQRPDLGLREMPLRDDLRMALALDAEALVVAQVQMQVVELEPGELAHVRAQPAGGEVLAADVHHQPSLGVARPVARPAAREAAGLGGAAGGACGSRRTRPPAGARRSSPRRRSAGGSPRRRGRGRGRPSPSRMSPGRRRRRRDATTRGRRSVSSARSDASSRASGRSCRRRPRGITIREPRRSLKVPSPPAHSRRAGIVSGRGLAACAPAAAAAAIDDGQDERATHDCQYPRREGSIRRAPGGRRKRRLRRRGRSARRGRGVDAGARAGAGREVRRGDGLRRRDAPRPGGRAPLAALREGANPPLARGAARPCWPPALAPSCSPRPPGAAPSGCPSRRSAGTRPS